VLVDGIPVSDTAAADDPVTPVAESRLDVLLPGAVLANPIDLLTGSAARSDDLLVFDAATVDDLARIAEVLDRLGRTAVAVGSAGLAKAVAARWVGSHPAPRPAPASRLLVTVSSLHPTALLQLAWLRHYLSRREDHDVQILTGPPERSDAAHATDIATQLAADVADPLQRSAYDGLVLVGGDGAAAVLDQLQVESVRIYSAVVPGAPDGRVVGGTADGLRLITKSGGFGGPDTLITIVQRLRSAHLASEAACAQPVSAYPNPKEDS
jgi:D-threonate/D-erythronate kinase